MIISPNIQERMTKAARATEAPVLRDGQIVEGKILKIHPNNRAEIQIGSHKMVAEVTTSLSVGRQYHFQVQANDNVIQLKVIGEHLKKDPKANIAQLVQQLGLKPSKVNVAFVQQLMQERIPYNQTQLVQAAQILEKAPVKSEAMQILKEMFQTRMPITNNVFQALLATREQGVSNLLHQLQQSIQADTKATPTEKRLLQAIQQLMNRPVTLEQKLTNEMIRRDSPLVSLLKLSGHIPSRANMQHVLSNHLNSLQQPSSTSQSMNQQATSTMNRANEANLINSSQVTGGRDTGNRSLTSTDSTAQSQKVMNRPNDPNAVLRQSEAASTASNRIQQGLENQAVNRQLFMNDTSMTNRQVILQALQSTMSEQELTNKTSASPEIKHDQTSTSQQATNQTQNRLPVFEQVIKSLFPNEQMTDKNISTRYASMQETMQHMLTNESSIQRASSRILNVFQGLQTGSLTEDQLVLARHMIQEQLMPQLQETMKQNMQTVIEKPTKENQQMLAQQLQAMSQKETYNIIRMVTTETADEKNWQQLPIQRQFISHVTQFMQALGMKDEHMLKQTIQQSFEQASSMQGQQIESESIKSMLLQLSNSQNTIGAERIQHMLYFINGMQLQSVQESNQFLHAAMQVPGEKLGLNEDMYMQFEGQKTADDTIDPDYCRILFVLHLEKIDQTIIDMHVQKRIISITIYNENEHLRQMMNVLQGPLKKKLHGMDYQVSSISLKPLYERAMPEQVKTLREPQKSEEERFDFRI